MTEPQAPRSSGLPLHVALYQPEIPPNTGNIIRLCANTGAQLHLVGKLGFSLDDKRLRRAGLDYAEYATLRTHEDLDALRAALPESRLLACTTRAEQFHSACNFQRDDILLFGPETRGLPPSVIASVPPQA